MFPEVHIKTIRDSILLQPMYSMLEELGIFLKMMKNAAQKHAEK